MRRSKTNTDSLQRKVARLFPHLDAQPLFGQHPQYGPRVLFAKAYGGNGITYSLFAFDRLK